jgi:hypothetical protein
MNMCADVSSGRLAATKRLDQRLVSFTVEKSAPSFGKAAYRSLLSMLKKLCQCFPLVDEICSRS